MMRAAESGSFLKKRTKKLLRITARSIRKGRSQNPGSLYPETPKPKQSNVFCRSFSKKQSFLPFPDRPARRSPAQGCSHGR
jgi:hypothetical protein